MKVTLFHNEGAGERAWSGERIVGALKRAGFEPDLVTFEDDWAAKLAAARGIVVAAGGDGTVAAAATTIVDPSTRLVILPTGSGNNIARSLGVFDELGAIIHGMPKAETEVRLRVCRAEGPWGTRLFVESVGLGVLARGVQELQDDKLDGIEKLKRGREATMRAVEQAEQVTAEVTVDDHPIAAPVLLVEAMNLSMIGANLRLVSAIPDDDRLLTVVCLPASDRGAAVEWLRAGANGASPFRRIRGRVVRFRGPPEPLRLEDKTVDWDGSEVTVTVEPTAVRVLVPGDRA